VEDQGKGKIGEGMNGWTSKNRGPRNWKGKFRIRSRIRVWKKRKRKKTFLKKNLRNSYGT